MCSSRRASEACCWLAAERARAVFGRMNARMSEISHIIYNKVERRMEIVSMR